MTAQRVSADQAFTARQSRAWFARIPRRETIYSAAARFHEACGYHRPESSSLLLFGHRLGGALIDLPIGLANLEHITGGTVRADAQTLRARTPFGPFLGLMSGERRAAFVAACRGTDIPVAKDRAGMDWNLITTAHALRICRQCARRQIARNGFAYWRADHQRPGVWLCREHDKPLAYMPMRSKKSLAWLQADHCLRGHLLIELPGLQHQDLELLRRVADVMEWMCMRTTLDVELLQVAARDRLASAGHLRNELACSQKEYEAIHEQFTKPLIVAGLPHFAGLRRPSWVRQTLIDRRNLHPLRWAVLLAAAGRVDPVSLDQALADASTRVVQPSLFASDDTRRRERAPMRVYQALTGPRTIADAARCSNLRMNELQRWLRRDPELVEHRRITNFEVRHRAACITLQGHARAHPEAMRSQVMAACVWAVRWLQNNDAATLDRLLPPTVAMFDRQDRLDFGDSASPKSDPSGAGVERTPHGGMRD